MFQTTGRSNKSPAWCILVYEIIDILDHYNQPLYVSLNTSLIHMSWFHRFYSIPIHIFQLYVNDHDCKYVYALFYLPLYSYNSLIYVDHIHLRIPNKWLLLCKYETCYMELVCLFVCLAKVLCHVSTPCGTGYMRCVSQINEGMIPHPL